MRPRWRLLLWQTRKREREKDGERERERDDERTGGLERASGRWVLV